MDPATMDCICANRLARDMWTRKGYCTVAVVMLEVGKGRPRSEVDKRCQGTNRTPQSPQPITYTSTLSTSKVQLKADRDLTLERLTTLVTDSFSSTISLLRSLAAYILFPGDRDHFIATLQTSRIYVYLSTPPTTKTLHNW